MKLGNTKEYSSISKISGSQITWELDIITQMAWISLQNFGIDNVVTSHYYMSTGSSVPSECPNPIFLIGLQHM